MLYNVISSGSKGNATIVYSHGKALLIDFGISKKRVSQAIQEYGIGFDDIAGFFITHIHSDHASDAYNADPEKLFAPELCLPHCEHMLLKDHLIRPFSTLLFQGFHVTAVPLSHDAKATVGYIVDDGSESLVYVTDTGFLPEKDYPYLTGKTYYIFESNHDPKMLYESQRPDYLIRRIISDTGHLSNRDAAYYLANLLTSATKEVVLAHLSDECNTPEIARKTYETVMQAQLGYLPKALLKIASDASETKGGSR
jgi:phosphoribosyl 1,2-cyclic phosphodiesterase